MREIKFRAWHNPHKEMIYNPNVCIVVLQQDLPEWDLMQYTGLKDKNGKEIYEGDIFTAGYWGTVGYYGEDTFVVELEQGAFRGFMQEYHKNKKERWSHSTPLYKLENLEVIGNIYENPELLDKGL
ncbi:hypothetical protein LCGC14_1999640 [marine sediment metagenome]|uniref:YopX protein domain-containing protein n=1 Tax=marine sediment metagenome TaxID=412755 RepID=A0A0F9F3V0_9ZZZZ